MNIYDMTRAYYAYIVRKTNKMNCRIALVYSTYDNVHTIMDALFFDGAFILDCGKDSIVDCDGCIDCNALIFNGVENDVLEGIVESKLYEHHNNATCEKYNGGD